MHAREAPAGRSPRSTRGRDGPVAGRATPRRRRRRQRHRRRHRRHRLTTSSVVRAGRDPDDAGDMAGEPLSGHITASPPSTSEHRSGRRSIAGSTRRLLHVGRRARARTRPGRYGLAASTDGDRCVLGARILDPQRFSVALCAWTRASPRGDRARRCRAAGSGCQRAASRSWRWPPSRWCRRSPR